MAYEGWAILEIMGHRQRAGYVREVEQFGVVQLQIDIYMPDETEIASSEFYGGPSIYSLRPATEEIARRMAGQLGDPRPAKPVAYRLAPPPPENANGHDHETDEADFENEQFA